MNSSFIRIVLENKIYMLKFEWNEYGKYWTFGIYTALQEPIVQSIKVISKFPLNLQYIDSRLPNGVFGIYTEKERVLRSDFKNRNAIFAYIPANQAEV